MEYTPPTRMESPNPASHVDRYYMRRVITDNQIELHWHNFFEIDFMDDGRGMHRLNGVERPFTRGTLSVLSPFDFHSYRHDHARKEFMSCFSFHFDDHAGRCRQDCGLLGGLFWEAVQAAVQLRKKKK